MGFLCGAARRRNRLRFLRRSGHAREASRRSRILCPRADSYSGSERGGRAGFARDRTTLGYVEYAVRALAEARNPSTSSARLDQLLQFAGSQGDYELDNRIAANPNSTPEILRKLYGRHQLGTLMILARSPKTPEDILQAMVDYDLTRPNQTFENEWIRKSLQQNPNLPEAVRRKL